MAQEHLNFSDIGVLQHHRGVGVAQNMRHDPLMKDFKADSRYKLLDTMDRHKWTATGAGEKIADRTGLDIAGPREEDIFQKKKTRHRGDRYRTADTGF